MNNLIEIKKLSVGFHSQGKQKTVVNSISFNIPKGKTVALVGESGSGKTVTALSILKLLPYPNAFHESGKIFFHNKNLLELKDEEIDWLLNSSCYQVGIVSSHDLKAMGNSLKKSYNALRNFGDLNELKLEESAWSFMALDSIFGLWEHRKARGDRRVIIVGNTGLPRK